MSTSKLGAMRASICFPTRRRRAYLAVALASLGAPDAEIVVVEDGPADEAGQSRVYGGIHFQFDNTAGKDAGRALGLL